MTVDQLIDFLIEKKERGITVSGVLIINPKDDDKRTLTIQENYDGICHRLKYDGKEKPVLWAISSVKN